MKTTHKLAKGFGRVAHRRAAKSHSGVSGWRIHPVLMYATHGTLRAMRQARGCACQGPHRYG